MQHRDLQIGQSLNPSGRTMEGNLAQSLEQLDCSTRASICSRQLGRDISDRRGAFQSFY